MFVRYFILCVIRDLITTLDFKKYLGVKIKSSNSDQPADRVNIEQSALGRLKGKVLYRLPCSNTLTQSTLFWDNFHFSVKERSLSI